jgi:hypothetical protein|nr:uncharacterized protein LOC4352683 [Oryza sativa Japonica Group]
MARASQDRSITCSICDFSLSLIRIKSTMSSATATASGGLHAAGGEWLGELSAALQGKWQAMVSTDQRRRRQRGDEADEKKGVAGAGAALGVETRRRKEEGDVGACGGAMSDTTVFLLLDHFAPS